MAFADQGKSIPQLTGELVTDIANLFRSEGRLMRTELNESVGRMASGVETMGAGIVLLLVALLVLVQALIIALAEWLGAGWASLLVGGVLALLGALMVAKARKDLAVRSLVPDRTLDQASKDVQLAREQAR